MLYSIQYTVLKRTELKPLEPLKLLCLGRKIFAKFITKSGFCERFCGNFVSKKLIMIALINL